MEPAMSEYPRPPENTKAWRPYRFDAYLGWSLVLLVGGYNTWSNWSNWRSGRFSQGWTRFHAYYVVEWVFELVLIGLLFSIARSHRIGMIVTAVILGLITAIFVSGSLMYGRFIPQTAPYAAVWIYCILRLTGVLRTKSVAI